MAELIFYREKREVMRVPLTQSFRLGRHPENDLTLTDESISRQHCTIALKDGKYLLTDHSRNGTSVNGKAVGETFLKNRDELQIGPWRVLFADQGGWADRVTAVRPKGQLPRSFCGLVGQSAGMKELFALIEKIAAREATALISGETGSGKELVARAIHELSPRSRNPFVTLNCGAISPQLIESELFGHEKGAFTGAADRHPGAFEQATTGSLFLDEVGELPLELQPKLLRVLEGQSYRRVGGREEIRADLRLIAATHRDLQTMVREGKFREDLFFRLYTVPIRIPSLRERREDLPALVDYFLCLLHPEGGKSFSPAALKKLQTHSWPGNVRELKNGVMRALLLSPGPVIQEGEIQFAFDGAPPPSASSRSLEDLQKEAIVRALKENDWNKRRSAEALGIAKSTLFQKIKEYGIKKN